MRILSAAVLLLAICLSPRTGGGSTVRLGCYGWQSAVVGCFDETQVDTLRLYLPNMVGAPRPDNPYLFGFISIDNSRVGCFWGDTEPDSGCSYDLTAWFEPGSIAIGHVVGPGGNNQNAMIQGAGWQGHLSTDFNALRIEYQERAPCSEIRTIVVPIEWFTDAPATVDARADFQAEIMVSPNPSPGPCRVSFQVATEGPVSVEIVDVSGRILRHLLGGPHPAGDYSVIWDGRDDEEREVASGTYWARVSTRDATTTGRVVVAK